MADNKLTRGYEDPLRAWKGRLLADPVEELESKDYGDYEWESGRLWKLESGQYAVITGSGCSCTYFGESVDQDTITLFQNEAQARAAFTEWDAGVSDYIKRGD